MENKKKKRIVIALGGNALGNTLPEQMKAVKITAKAIVDLIEEGCEVIVAHGNGPQVGMINNAMARIEHVKMQTAKHTSFCLCCNEPGLHRLRLTERSERRAVTTAIFMISRLLQ